MLCPNRRQPNHRNNRQTVPRLPNNHQPTPSNTDTGDTNIAVNVDGENHTSDVILSANAPATKNTSTVPFIFSIDAPPPDYNCFQPINLTVPPPSYDDFMRNT